LTERRGKLRLYGVIEEGKKNHLKNGGTHNTISHIFPVLSESNGYWPRQGTRSVENLLKQGVTSWTAWPDILLNI